MLYGRSALKVAIKAVIFRSIEFAVQAIYYRQFWYCSFFVNTGNSANHGPQCAIAIAIYINHMLVRNPRGPGVRHRRDGIV